MATEQSPTTMEPTEPKPTTESTNTTKTGSELDWKRLMNLNTSPVATDREIDLRVDVTWVNLYAGTDWTILRFKSAEPIDRLVVKLGKVIEKGYFEYFEYLFNVFASKHALYVTVGCVKRLDEVKDELFL